MFDLARMWPTLLDDPTEARDRDHRFAIYEARKAREQAAVTTRRSEAGLLDRIREALRFAPANPECADCTA